MVQSMTSVVKAANFILARPTLSKIITPLAQNSLLMQGIEKWD